MKYKIIADSSCDLYSDYIKDSNVGFEIAPLKIFVNGCDFVDDDHVDVQSLLQETDKSKIAGKTSCPSPNGFARYYDDAEIIVVVTISSKMSGSYNSALSAIELSNNKNVIVIDSKAVAGVMDLIIDKAYELMKRDNLSFGELKDALEAYRNSLNLFFVLDKFDNLIKNGRMNKILAYIATALLIKPISYAYEGQIKILEKVRTSKGAYKRLVLHIRKKVDDGAGRTCIITYVNNKETAEAVKSMIIENYKFDQVIIRPAKGLTSFYALENGLLVGF